MKIWYRWLMMGIMIAANTLLHAQSDEIWQPEPGASWQIQLQGDINTSYDVDMYVLDLFDTPQEVIDELHAEQRKVICYFSAGSWEEWRTDANDFPEIVLGKDLIGWEGERWLDIRQ